MIILVSSAFAMCRMPPANMFPADGATGVPIDARVVWGTDISYRDEPLLMTDPDGVEVAVTVTWTESAGSTLYATLAPDAPLAPNTTYTVADPWNTYSFTTGEAGSSEAPAVPEVAATEAEADYSHDLVCPGEVTATESGREHVYVTLDVAAPPDGYLEARVRVDGGPEHVAFGGERIFLARGGCYASNLPDMDGSQQVEVSLRAVTYAGEESAWSAPTVVDVPWPTIECAEAAGCDTGATSAGAGGLLAAALLLARRRRRG